jgi:hypothetical protein
MEATGISRAVRRRRRRRRTPDFAWLRRHWLRLVLGAVFALGFLFAKLITRI